MSAVESIIFDLDGTLWDTCATCAIGWNNVLRRNQIDFREISASDVREVAGMPQDDCIRHVFRGLSEDRLQLLISETAEEDNRIIAELGAELYPFVKEGLERLHRQHRIFIVSNCQSGYIETFLHYSKLNSLVTDFECFGNTQKSKSENIKILIARNSVKSAIYIGDTAGDQTAAAEAGLPFAFVEYGFGTCLEADLRCRSFEELVQSLESFHSAREIAKIDGSPSTV